uniref:Uncharacterized protein n=1 Tax=Sphaerodactylus townsendi TaxID=933632 RepID=A0ACB8E829_9SAUR
MGSGGFCSLFPAMALQAGELLALPWMEKEGAAEACLPPVEQWPNTPQSSWKQLKRAPRQPSYGWICVCGGGIHGCCLGGREVAWLLESPLSPRAAPGGRLARLRWRQPGSFLHNLFRHWLGAGELFKLCHGWKGLPEAARFTCRLEPNTMNKETGQGQEQPSCENWDPCVIVLTNVSRERAASQSIKMSLRKQTPSDFLKQIIGRPVVVKLNSGVDYRGVLACLDGYMNIALEQTEEYVNGQLKNKYGDAFIRGNNGNYAQS